MNGHGEAGYSLLEVVVAFAIGSLALALLYGSAGSALDREQISVQRLKQQSVAENIIERVGIDFALQGGEQSGESDTGIRWRLLIDEVGNGTDDGSLSGNLRLYKVEAAAWARDEGAATRLVTYQIKIEDG